MKAVSPGRLAAIRALVQIERGRHAEEALADARLGDPGQRALALYLCLGVLRRRGALDLTLTRYVRRGLDSLDPAVLATLRVGLYDAVHSRIAPEVAVDQAVEAARALGSPAGGLVNAVLRRAVAEGIADDPFLDLPPWLAARWRDQGPWVARLREPAPVCAVGRDPGWTPDPSLDAVPATSAGEPVADAWVLRGLKGAVERAAGFEQGQWWVMDPSAAKVADLVLDALGEARGARVLDATAAPGGKALRLASRGAEVLAVDSAPQRLDRVRENVARTGLKLEIRQHDWLRGPLPDAGLCDAVLVDAPCTGLGIIRRHPEIRWLRLPSDPAAMALRQRPLLLAASQHVAPGGALVYAVCSPMPEEGRGVVDSLAGWRVERTWTSFPPAGDEDAFQSFVLRRER